MRHQRTGRLAVVLAMVGFAAAVAVAAEPQSKNALPKAEQTGPAYPRVNLCTCYEVDPAWPQRPAHITWAAVPSIAVDQHDAVWIFNRAEPFIQIYTAAGKFVRALDVHVGTAHFMRFDPAGKLWITDVKEHVVTQLTLDGKILRTLGTRNAAGVDAAHFNKPTDVAVTPEGDIYISDGYGNNRVVQFDKDGRYVRAWGELGTGPGQFSLPHSIVVDRQGRLYVADRNNARIQVFDAQGRFLDQWTNILVPWGLWLTKEGDLWACGSSPMGWRPEDKLLSCPPKDQIAVRFSPAGRVLQIWTFPMGKDGAEKPGELNWLHGIAVDSLGNLYVGDILGKRAQKFVLQK